MKKQLSWALKHKSLIVGLVIVGFVMLVALFGPYLTARDPYKHSLPRGLEAPSLEMPFGTDSLGRDLFARIIYGARYSVAVGVFAVLGGVLVGSYLGIMGGYFGGVWDTLVGRLIDVMLAFPGLLLALAVVSALGSNLTNLTIAIGIANIPRFARLVRGSVLSVKNEEYLEAIRSQGAGNVRIICKHIIPNILAPLMVQMSFSVAGAILAASGLSFLGLGAQPPLPEWGVMLSQSRDYMRVAPHVVIFPGLAIVIVIIGLNILGDALRDLWDPKI